jgi:tetratricopeptide (TPR) repeat protein
VVLEKAAAEEQEHLEAEQRQREDAEGRQSEEKRRLEGEQRQREEKERLEARGPAQAETPPIIRSKGSAWRRSSARVVLVVLTLILITICAVVLIASGIWFGGTNHDHALQRSTPAPTPTVESTPTPERIPTATTRDPAYRRRVINTGIDFFNDSRYEDAISKYTEVIDLDPNDPVNGFVYYLRGKAYRELGRTAEAQADFDKAKQLGYTSSQYP